MKLAPWILTALAYGAGVSAPLELATDYTHGKTLRLVRTTEVSQETTELTMERDGEPMEHGDFGGRPRTNVCTVAWLDTVKDHEDGAPTALERAFESAELVSSEDGESQESPLAGETVELSLDEDGEVVARADGVDDEVLAGQQLRLPLDGLLPADDVSPGDSWDLDAEALQAALGVDVFEALFPRPEFDPQAGHALRRDSSTRLLLAAEWDATATLTDEQAEVGGLSALVITLELEGEGELEEEFMGTGGGRRALGRPADAAPVLAAEFEVRLEGRLLFSPEAGRPLSLELEGSYVIESEIEVEAGDSVINMHRVQEGSFEQSLTITVEEE